MSKSDFHTLNKVVQNRKTQKVLADPAAPLPKLAEQAGLRDHVHDAIQLAGWAPFHYDRKLDGIREPWRFHVIWKDTCEEISRRIPSMFDDVKPSNKLRSMLSACGALILVNWLPQFRGAETSSEFSAEKQLQIDDEHLAATACAVQTLLLALTTKGFGTYWSSGGFFRTQKMFNELGIASTERLLAAVFIDFAPDSHNELIVERIPGKHRDHRSNWSAWTNEISLKQ